jgi:hypothetical protein
MEKLREIYGVSLMDDLFRMFPNLRMDSFPPGCLTIVSRLATPPPSPPPHTGCETHRVIVSEMPSGSRCELTRGRRLRCAEWGFCASIGDFVSTVCVSQCRAAALREGGVLCPDEVPNHRVQGGRADRRATHAHEGTVLLFPGSLFAPHDDREGAQLTFTQALITYFFSHTNLPLSFSHSLKEHTHTHTHTLHTNPAGCRSHHAANPGQISAPRHPRPNGRRVALLRVSSLRRLRGRQRARLLLRHGGSHAQLLHEHVGAPHSPALLLRHPGERYLPSPSPELQCHPPHVPSSCKKPSKARTRK